MCPEFGRPERPVSRGPRAQSREWEPSQYGALAVLLHPHHATFPSFSNRTRSGVNPRARVRAVTVRLVQRTSARAPPFLARRLLLHVRSLLGALGLVRHEDLLSDGAGRGEPCAPSMSRSRRPWMPGSREWHQTSPLPRSENTRRACGPTSVSSGRGWISPDIACSDMERIRLLGQEARALFGQPRRAGQIPRGSPDDSLATPTARLP